MTRRATLLVLPLLLVLAGFLDAAPGGLRLPGDVGLEAEVETADQRFIEVRVGRTRYELERRTLEGEALEALPAVDHRATFIEQLLPHLTSADARVGLAAQAALVSLGKDSAPLLEAARERTGSSEARAALARVLDRLGAPVPTR